LVSPPRQPGRPASRQGKTAMKRSHGNQRAARMETRTSLTRPRNPRRKTTPEFGKEDAHRDARGASSTVRGFSRTQREGLACLALTLATPKSATKTRFVLRTRGLPHGPLDTKACDREDSPGLSGPSLKLSRRSTGCQRIERVSRMRPEVHVVQSLNL